MTSPAVFYADPHIGLKFRVRNAAHTTPLGHSGQDIKGWSEGTWIPNFAAGKIVRKVTDEENPDDLGNFIVIECRIGGERYFITHCHLASFGGTKGVGAEIKFGEGIGPIGNTGYSKGTHDHIMASKESMYPNARVWLVDPLPLILACRAGTAGGGTSPITTGEDDMPIMRELIESPDGTVWYCYERILRFAIPEPRNLATYQAHLRALGHSDTIVKKSALDMAAYGSPVFDNPGKYLATAVDSVISDEAIEAKLAANTGNGAPALDVAALVAAINALPAKSAEATRAALAAALAG